MNNRENKYIEVLEMMMEMFINIPRPNMDRTTFERINSIRKKIYKLIEDLKEE